jgi:hypothetical protein
MGQGLSSHLHISIRRGKNDFNHLGVRLTCNVVHDFLERQQKQLQIHTAINSDDFLGRRTSFKGCLKFSELIFKVSSLEIFFLTAGFSKTIFKTDPLRTVFKEVAVKAVAVDTRAVTLICRNFILVVDVSSNDNRTI